MNRKLTIEEAATRAGVSPGTIRNWLRKGDATTADGGYPNPKNGELTRFRQPNGYNLVDEVELAELSAAKLDQLGGIPVRPEQIATRQERDL